MERWTRRLVVGASLRRAAGWAGVGLALFLAPVAYADLSSSNFGAAISAGLALALLGVVLAGVQGATNGSMLLSWLLTAAPLVGIGVTLGPPLTAPPPLALLVTFFGTTAHLAGTVAARDRDIEPHPVRRPERLGLQAVVVASGLAFAAVYVVPLWLS